MHVTSTIVEYQERKAGRKKNVLYDSLDGSFGIKISKCHLVTYSKGLNVKNMLVKCKNKLGFSAEAVHLLL